MLRPLLLLVIGACLASAGSPGWVATASAATPTAQQIVLSPSDFPAGAAVVAQTGAVSASLSGGIAHSSGYTRTFSDAEFHGFAFATIISTGTVAKNATSASHFMSELAQVAHSSAQKQAYVKSLLAGLGTTSKTKPDSATLIRARTFHVPDEVLDLVVRLRYGHRSVDLGTLYVVRGIAISATIYIEPVPGAKPTVVVALAKAIEAHLQIAFASVPPANSVAPSISGLAQVGQTLTLQQGTWTGNADMQIQWLLCSAAGSQCVAISGAISTTYIVPAADVGSTLAVDVTATNGAGITSVQSAPTAIIA